MSDSARLPGRPSGRPPGPPPAAVLPRFAARLVDGLVVAAATVVLTALLHVVVGGYPAAAMSAVVGTLLYLGYFVYLEVTRGRTLGKRALNLHVVGPGGTGHPTLEESVRRNLWAVVGVLGVLGPGGSDLGLVLGLVATVAIAVTISTDPEHRQSLFDRLAGGTQVRAGDVPRWEVSR